MLSLPSIRHLLDPRHDHLTPHLDRFVALLTCDTIRLIGRLDVNDALPVLRANSERLIALLATASENSLGIEALNHALRISAMLTARCFLGWLQKVYSPAGHADWAA